MKAAILEFRPTVVSGFIQSPPRVERVRLFGLDDLSVRPRRLVCHWRRDADGRLACIWEPDIPPASHH